MEPEVIKKTHCGEVDSKNARLHETFFAVMGFRSWRKLLGTILEALQPIFAAQR